MSRSRGLREDHDFPRLSTSRPFPRPIPSGSAGGLYADRVSINVELPTERPEAASRRKSGAQIEGAMGGMKAHRERQGREEVQVRAAFAPAGQSTQMIVGAMRRRTATSSPASLLYDRFGLRRVYYSPSRRSRTPVRCCRCSARR
jgi:predicted DNA-binding helix-hairpin-helix protein